MWISKKEVRSQEPEVRRRGRASRFGARHSTFDRIFEFRVSSFEIRLLLAAFCILLSAYSVLALGGRYSVTEVKPHVFVWVPEEIHDLDGDPDFTVAGNSGFVIGTEGVIVIDTTNTPFHAREVIYEIRQRTDTPVKYVINTDSHGDNVLGNEAFTDQKAIIISTPVVAAEMRDYKHNLAKRVAEDGEAGLRMKQRMRGIHVTLPMQTINQEMSIGVGGEEVKLLLPMAGPSPGNLVVYLPHSKVVFLGDLYENGEMPKLEGVDVRKWVDYLRKVETWDVDVIVPGHGAPGDKNSLEAFIKTLEKSETPPTPTGKP
jgi:glyoxylase-like metal-dependent hydrolase (beta-lactamase superfamily II)